MKIIVNERQYSLIKGFIDEVKGKKYPKDIMNKLGKDIVNVFDEIGQGKTTEFQLGSGNKVILKCISDDNYVFKFEIIEDTSKALKKWDILEIKINPGNGDTDGTEKEYNLNSNVIEPAQNGNGFTLIFQASKKTGPKGKVKLNAITKISPSSVTKQEEPKPEETPEEPKASGDTENEKTISKADAKAAYEKILNNPELRNAFYKQPSFWEMFKAELKGEKPTGTGIITALDILDKYNLRQYNEKLSKMLTPNEKVTIKFLEDYTIEFGENKTITFNSFEKYFLKVVKKNTNETQVLYGKKDNIDYYLPLTNPEPEKNDDSGDVFTSIIGKEKYMFRILTDENESPGYNNESED